MSQVQNLPVPLKLVDAFLASMENGVSDADQASAALALIDGLKSARKTLTEGFNRKELTVCNGKLGYVDPKDAARFLSGEIPRLTVYRKKKDAHNMALHFKRPPKFYQENKACKPMKRSTGNTTTATSKSRARRNESSGPKPKKS